MSRGSGMPTVEGKVLSVLAAVEGDLGNPKKAVEILRKAVRLFEIASNSPLVNRTLVQIAYILADADESLEALRVIDHALTIIHPTDLRLILLAESIRVNCLLGLGASREALIRFHALGELYDQFSDSFLQLRRRFISARILEDLGYFRKAEKIYSDVIAGDLEHGLVKDFFLDLVYLFGAFLRRGQTGDALAVCRRAIQDTSLLQEVEGTSAAACDQMRTLWMKLEKGIEQGTIGLGAVAVMRDYPPVA